MTDATPKLDAPVALAPTLFLLHFLGGSARTWDAIVERFGPGVVCRAIDLPGFGDAAPLEAYSVEGMADHVAAIVRETAPSRWLLVGHSMGAKIAAVVARRAENGEAGLAGLVGLVLVAGSPPAPEPMDEARRGSMLDWFEGDAATTREQASAFIGMNVGAALDHNRHARAVDDVVRMNRSAWQAWLERGSREDWSAFVGRLTAPTLIVAGGEDRDLGAEAQQRLMAPHFDDARLLTLDGAGHLLPIERAGEIAELILSHLDGSADVDVALPDPAYRALLRSDRVSARTRRVLLDRARPDDRTSEPAALPPDLHAVLRAVVDRVLPQRSVPPIDLAARVDAELAAGAGDGWRFAALPPDAEAMSAGLATLDAVARADVGTSFDGLDSSSRDALLRRVDEGGVGLDAKPGALSADQMKLWFEDLRAALVRIYVSHPATLARIGYSGIANGGDGVRKQGFVETRADRPEPWEPRGIAGRRA